MSKESKSNVYFNFATCKLQFANKTHFPKSLMYIYIYIYIFFFNFFYKKHKTWLGLNVFLIYINISQLINYKSFWTIACHFWNKISQLKFNQRLWLIWLLSNRLNLLIVFCLCLSVCVCAKETKQHSATAARNTTMVKKNLL